MPLPLGEELLPDSVLALKDGGIVIGGMRRVVGELPQAWLLRLDPTGLVDTQFGDGGFATLPASQRIDRVKLFDDRNNGVLVAIQRLTPAVSPAGFTDLTRVSGSGIADALFGDAGIAAVVGGLSELTSFEIAVNTAGEALVLSSGFARKLDTGGNQVRPFGNYSDGVDDDLISSFLPPHVAADFQVPVSVGMAIQFTPSGKIRKTGWTRQGSTLLWPVTQYSASGTFDPSFGDGGVVLGAPLFNISFDSPRAATFLDDGSVYVVLRRDSSGGAFDAWLGRLLPDGATDLQFGAGGRAPVSYARNGIDYDLEPVALMTSSLGRAVIGLVGGRRGTGLRTSLLVTRRDALGDRDTAYPSPGNGDGWAEISDPAAAWQDLKVSYAIQPDDKVLVLASYRTSATGPRTTTLYRINP